MIILNRDNEQRKFLTLTSTAKEINTISTTCKTCSLSFVITTFSSINQTRSNVTITLDAGNIQQNLRS
jgi:hypothetical protein